MSAESPPDAATPPAGHPGFGGEFSTAMAHFYRAEVTRSNTWRSRLDATTNWAVVTTGAALSFAFGAVTNTPVVILIVTWLVVLFLFIEARRYRYYELWSYRVRLLERNYLSALLSDHVVGRPDWRERMVESLRNPAFPISLGEALGRRYRRNYAPLFLVLAGSWMVKVLIHPTPVASWRGFVERAAVGPLHGGWVLAAGLVFNALLVALGLFTVGLRHAEGEVLAAPPGGRLVARVVAATREALEIDLAAFRPSVREGRKVMVIIISDEVDKISRPLLDELDRGVTRLQGRGMYSGREHGVLLCVASRRETARLRQIVREHDPHAFVVVTGTEDVRGEGFRPLET